MNTAPAFAYGNGREKTLGPRVLILGYGNPGRQDDGLGPALVEVIEGRGWTNLTAYENYQLTVEDALEVAQCDVVWFVDALKVGSEPYSISALAPTFTMDFTSHLVRPEVILGLAQQYYGKTPEAHLLGIRGYGFAFVEALTEAAAINLDLALAELTARLSTVCAPRAA